MSKATDKLLWTIQAAAHNQREISNDDNNDTFCRLESQRHA